jgi:hypothetical protein
MTHQEKIVAASAKFDKVCGAASVELDKLYDLDTFVYYEASDSAKAECTKLRNAAWAAYDKVCDMAWTGHS